MKNMLCSTDSPMRISTWRAARPCAALRKTMQQFHQDAENAEQEIARAAQSSLESTGKFALVFAKTLFRKPMNTFYALPAEGRTSTHCL